LRPHHFDERARRSSSLNSKSPDSSQKKQQVKRTTSSIAKMNAPCSANFGALRYFLLKFTVLQLSPFDFKKRFSFEVRLDPHLQYAAVRANQSSASWIIRQAPKLRRCIVKAAASQEGSRS